MNKAKFQHSKFFEGVMLAVAGVLLLTPGFMTDALGMVVLLPAPRAAIAKYLMSKMVVKTMHGGGFQGGFSNQGPFEQDPFHRDPFDSRSDNGNTFEGEYERKDDDDRNKLN